MDTTTSAFYPYVILDPHARNHGNVGIQAVEGCSDDQVCGNITELSHHSNDRRQTMDHYAQPFPSNGWLPTTCYHI